ncbi:MAG: nucleoside triphosphate hydrolase [Phyllobacterium sp.]
MTTTRDLVTAILNKAETTDRLVVAIAGAPGSGKSTLAKRLKLEIDGISPGISTVIPMDGFHLDNAVLDARHLRHRKGAPETFDCPGFEVLLKRLRSRRSEIVIPLFDRTLDLARAGASIVSPDHRILLVEGNYLLLDESPWNRLAPLFDLTIFLHVARGELERRLVQRWLDHGHDHDAARKRALSNDLPNAERVISRSVTADWSLGSLS